MIRRFDEEKAVLPDAGETLSPELKRALRNQASFSFRFGTWKAVRGKILPMLQRREPLEVLDLGTGGGDIPRAVVREARRLQCPVSVTAVDNRKGVLDVAEKNSTDYPEIRYVEADILMFEPSTPANLVMCNQTLHNFDEVAVIRLLRKCPLMAQEGVLITDLRRSRLAQAAAFSVTALRYRLRPILYDACVSIERAFSYAELHRLAVAAGWWGFEHRRIPYFRQMLWLNPNQPRR